MSIIENRPKILLIDDCRKNRKTYSCYLQQQQKYAYKIVEACSGEEAISIALQQFPNVIILDNQLRDMEGLQVINRLKKLRKTVFLPVILLISQAQEKAAIASLKIVISDYFFKHEVNAASLQLAVNYAIKQSTLYAKQQQELEKMQEEFSQQNQALIVAQQTAECERQRYQNLFSQAPESYFVTDFDGTIQEVNQAAIALFNIPSQQLIGQSLVDFIIEPCHKTLLTKLTKSELVKNWRVYLKCNAGDPFPVLLSIATIYNSQQRPISLFWSIRDIRDSKQAQQKIHEQANLSDISTTVENCCTLVSNQAKQPQSILLINTDIAEEKHLETQFNCVQKLEALGILASSIAHDLNNIFQPILFTANLLRQQSSSRDQQITNALKIIEDNSQRGISLIRQILSFVYEEREAQQCTIVQVKSLLEEVVQMAEKTFFKSMEIEFKLLHQEELWTVSANATQLYQVFINLMVNARDAMSDEGKLTITAENVWLKPSEINNTLETTESPYLVINFIDTGMGLPPEIRERIFDPFFTTKEPGKGTGLGLFSVLNIIKNHEGFIKVSSVVGKGSQFSVFLPAAFPQHL